MEDEFRKIIEGNPVALATIDNENNPYVIAVAFVKVKDDKIIITNNYMKTTLDNINKNPNVSLVVWNSDLKGVQAKGIAEYFEDGEWCEFVKQIPENSDEPCKGALVVTIKDIKSVG